MSLEKQRIMTDKDWWKPEKLQDNQKKIKKRKCVGDYTNKSDFLSYRVMLQTNDKLSSNIKAHNETRPTYRVNYLKKILGDFLPEHIVDLGCGLGFTTHALSKVYPKANVLGVDISKDAIDYATHQFPSCDFLLKAINPKDSAQEISADLICAFEFYPFTRTDSIDEHKAYLNHLTKHLNLRGKLIIFQNWDNETSLSSTYVRVVHDLSHLNFQIYSMPASKIGVIVSNRQFANMISVFVLLIYNFICKKPQGKKKMIVVEKKN